MNVASSDQIGVPHDWESLSVSERRRLAVVAGHTHNPSVALLALNDPDSSVRVVAIGAVARLNLLTLARIHTALTDQDSVVARRAIETLAPMTFGESELDQLDDLLVGALKGTNDAVAEVAGWALGERHQEDFANAPASVVAALIEAATDHREALVRESSTAALGAVGHPDSLPAVLKACRDKATVRRRAIIALAAFDGPTVTEALQRALSDRDWQVRQAAEDLLTIAAGPSEQT